MKQKLHAWIAPLLVAVLTVALLCGCHNKTENRSDETSVIEPASPDSENTAVQELSMTNDESVTDPKETTGSAMATEKSAVASGQDKMPSVPAKGSETTALPSQTIEPEKGSTPASFTACSISTSQLGIFRYWLYAPSNPTENMPLIVYLHGGSGKGDDLNLITAVDGFPQYLQDGRLGNIRAYVVIPQLPSTQKGWINAAGAISDLINQTVSAYGIDRNNISLTGHSMGGTGTWALACAYPNLFTRIAPLSGGIRNAPDRIDKLKSVPIRAFAGSADAIVPPDSSREVVAALQAAGGDAEITVFDGADHFSVPGLTFLDPTIDLIGWLTGG